jgi:hypothetical protein
MNEIEIEFLETNLSNFFREGRIPRSSSQMIHCQLHLKTRFQRWATSNDMTTRNDV